MIYKVLVILDNGEEHVMYQGSDKHSADNAWFVSSGCGYVREYYEGTVSWERTKSMLS